MMKSLRLLLAFLAAMVPPVAQAQFNSGAGTKAVLIDSFRDLGSVLPSQNRKSVVIIRYGNTEGDQLGGSFMYDESSTATPDGLNAFIPASGVGRWLRFDQSAFVQAAGQTANRLLITDATGAVTTTNDLAFNGSLLDVTAAVRMLARNEVRYYDSDSSNYIGLKAPGTVSSDLALSLPAALPSTSGYALVSDITGQLSFSELAGTSSEGEKLVGPAIYFDGADDYFAIADDNLLSFVNTSTPVILSSDLPFSIESWVKMDDATDFTIVSKGDATSPREYEFGTDNNDKLHLTLRDNSLAINIGAVSDLAMTQYQGKWTHFAATYSAGTANASAANAITLYVNGAQVASTAANSGTYAGMENTAAALWFGRAETGVFAQGHIRSARSFNRALSAAEVDEVQDGGTGFQDEWAEAHAATYQSDHSAGVDSFVASQGAVAGNIDSIGGQNDNLRFTVNTASASHSVSRPTTMSNGKTYRVTFWYFIPSSNSHIDGLALHSSFAGSQLKTAFTPTLDAWNYFQFDWEKDPSTGLQIVFYDGGVGTFADAGGDDVAYIRAVTVTKVGVVWDFRAENFDESVGKLYDVSGAGFIGVATGGPVLTGREFPTYAYGVWTPALSFGGGSTGLTYAGREGYWTKVGNLVFVQGAITLSAKGSSTGTAVIAGLPYENMNLNNFNTAVNVARASNMASLTSAPSGSVTDNSNTINLYDWGAAGSVVLDETNFTDTTSVGFSTIYRVK